jgi:hypothetical protein
MALDPPTLEDPARGRETDLLNDTGDAFWSVSPFSTMTPRAGTPTS